MKKIVRMLIAGVLVAVSAFGFAACNGGDDGVRAMATAIGVGHGGTVTEVTVIVDGNANVLKVQFDEIMPVSYAVDKGNAAADAELKSEITIGSGTSAYTVVVANTISRGSVSKKQIVKDIYIGGTKFTAKIDEGTNGNDKVADTYLGHYGTLNGTEINAGDHASSAAGIQWYYDAFIANKLRYASAEGATFSTSYGSMRKRYSSYWSYENPISQFTGLGLKGNMEALENYLLVYGFDGINATATSAGDQTNIKLEGGFVTINGVNTGATLSGDTWMYMTVAKKAYDAAVAKLA